MLMHPSFLQCNCYCNTTPIEENPNPSMKVTKTVENKEYKLDETITFTITITNTGNIPLTNVIISEIEEVTIDLNTINRIAVNNSVTVQATYVITEEDILNGGFINTITVSCSELDESIIAEATAYTEPSSPSLSITKLSTTTPENSESYALGERIYYSIVLTNDGNLTITNITMHDQLTGDTWTIDSLTPGQSKDFIASYVVTETDILRGEVLNGVTATGTSLSLDYPDVTEVAEDLEETDACNGHLLVTITETSSPLNSNYYEEGEQTAVKITVTNNGNLTINDIFINCALSEERWTIASLPPSASREFLTTYTITHADAQAGQLTYIATATGTSPDPEESDVPSTPGELTLITNLDL